ncbi:MAG: TIM barrel protein [Planctomycetaceae bacterium]
MTISMPRISEVSRRDFLGTLSAGAAGLALMSGVAAGRSIERSEAGAQGERSRFRRAYAPHLGMFRHLGGDDPLEQIRFMAGEGFAALEDNSFLNRPLREQEKIARGLAHHGMRMGLFVGSADFGNPTFASGRKDFRLQVLGDVSRAAEAARRANASGFIVVPGRRDEWLSDDCQQANAVDLLKRCAEICERTNTRMFLEPLNHWGRSPQMYLHSMAQGGELCEAVGSDHCRLLFDLYHQAVTEPDVLELAAKHWDNIGYFQIGDFPGRKEPGTGSFDFRRFFALTDSRGYDGLFGMEHGNSAPGIEGERAVVAAYRRLERA